MADNLANALKVAFSERVLPQYDAPPGTEPVPNPEINNLLLALRSLITAYLARLTVQPDNDSGFDEPKHEPFITTGTHG